MPFIDLSQTPEREPVDGFKVRLVHTDNMTIAYWAIRAGASLPAHHHPHEQVANVLEGEFELTVGDESGIMTPGDVAVIPPDVPHAGRAVTDCRILDVFHPVREDYR